MKQITVLVENRPGLIADLSQVLADASVNIETLNVEGADEHGVAILTVDRYDDALRALRDAGFRAISEDALVIRMKNEPGSLAQVARRFKDAQINIRSMHIIERRADYSLAAIVAERTDAARKLVADLLIS